MVTFTEGVKNALRAFPCAALANGEYAYGFAARIFPLTPAGRIADGLGGLRRLLGCDPANDPVEPLPPFPGGQCPAVYVVTYQGLQNGVVQISGTIAARGPILGIRGRITETGARIIELNCTGVNLGSNSCISIPNGGQGWRLLGGVGSSGPQPTAAIISITPCGANDCGSLPPEYPDPTDFPTPIDITYNIEEGDEVTVTVPFIFAPVKVDLSGNFSIPFTFNLGGIDFSGELQLTPTIEVNINPPTARRGTGDGIDELPPGDSEDEKEPQPQSEKVIGVAVVSVLVGEQRLTSIATTDIPRILAPRAGSIKFAYSLGVSTFWSDDIDIKSDRTFIPCPFSQGADFVAVSPAPGVEVIWRAVTGYPLATVADVV